jgi:GNAT superfamily N-acetyltransferase
MTPARGPRGLGPRQEQAPQGLRRAQPADASAADAGVVFAAVIAGECSAPALRADLLSTWVAVTDAGGAVGFTPPADIEAIADVLDGALQAVSSGRDALGILRRGDEAVGMGFLVDRGSALQRHWRTVLRVMVRPELQGAGAGGLLLEGLHGVARELSLEQLRLTVRGGTGVERFYERFGYVVVGRHPGALRLAPGDDRDEIMMVTRL